MPSDSTEWLREEALREGVSLFGTADIRRFKDTFLLAPDEAKSLHYAVSIGIRLSPAVLHGITTKPTLLYKWHYQQANQFLDKVAFLLSQKIMERGYRALPIPSSQIVDWENHRGHVSHRMVGEAAGLGWRGRNNLLVHPRYGSQFRLTTILTDLALDSSPLIENQCGSCHRCVGACPAQAIGESSNEYQLTKCHELLTRFSKERGIGVHICGICVKVCGGVRDSSVCETTKPLTE